MKRYKFRNGPNKLLGANVWKLDPDSVVALVSLETEHGEVTFAINRGWAEEIRNQMQAFLDGKAEPFPG